MNLSSPFIHRPVMTFLATLGLVLLGILSFTRLPVSNLPDVDYPTINVTTVYPGASPETMANNVATPLEKEFMTIPGIKSVTSSNTLGNSNIVLQFGINKSMDSAALDVEAAISRAKTKLPPDLPNDPTYRKVNPAQTPIVYIALTSDTVPVWDLYTYANTFIGQRLTMIEGVAQVLTFGSPFAVRVQVDPYTLASVAVTLEETRDAIREGNPYLPTGQLNGPVRSSTIVSDGQLVNAEEYNPLILSYVDNGTVRVQNVGQAVDSLQNDRYSLHYIDRDQSQLAVVLAVQRQPGANTVAVADAITQFLPELEKQLPASVALKVVFDRAETIKESVHEVEFTLLIAFLLVVFVIYLYLGKITDTVIPSLILPTSVIGTFIFMDLFGYTLDNLSLLAMIIAIGFIVDDAIVVLENVVRRVEEGESPWVASLQGSKQIGFTIVSMNLSLIAVFIPMIFMGGLIGKIFREFAVTLTVITILSGVIALTLTPVLCSLFVPARKNGEKIRGIAKYSTKGNDFLLALYKPMLRWVLRHRAVALVAAILSVLVSLYLFAVIPKDFIPDDDIGFIIGFTQAAQGTSSDRMAEYQEQVNAILQKEPAVDTFVSISSFQQFRDGILFIRLVPRSQRPGVMQVIQDFYRKTSGIVGLRTFYRNVPLIDLSTGIDVKGAYQYTLQSLDPESLYVSAEEFIEKMKELPDFQGVTSNLELENPQLHVAILRDEASSLGVSAEKIETAFLLGYSGGRSSRIQTPLDQYDVILELEKRFQVEPATLAGMYVRSDLTQALVPLAAVARWKEGIGPTSINHDGQFPAVTISFGLSPGIPLGTALQELEDLGRNVLPENVSGVVKGAAETFQESIRSTTFLIFVALVAIYIILGMLYESLIHPITILSTLPPATLGALVALALFGYPLSMYAYLGVILLLGIVKKNGIIMVDYALDNIREKGETAEKSIYDACIVRFRPIMMTTVTTIMGAIPVAFAIGPGAESRRPLGVVIVAGLLVCQLITLFITPVIYLYLEQIREWFFPPVAT